MRRCNALEEFVFVSLHKEKKFPEPRQLTPPDNQTAHIQVNCNIFITCNVSNKRDSVPSGYPNTEKRVENTTRSGVFLVKSDVFG